MEVNTEVHGIAHSGLVTYYEGLGDSGLATLLKDIETCRLQIISNTDSGTDEDESLAADDEDGINYTTQNIEDDIRFDSGGDEGGLGELRTGIPADGTPLKIDRVPNEVEDGNQSSVVAAVGEEDVKRDDEGFSIDIDSNESINGGTTPTDASHTNISSTTDENNAPPTTSTDGNFSFDCNGGDKPTAVGLGELDTAPANEPTPTQSSTTTTTLNTALKVDISCVGNGVEGNREVDDPSPTGVNADISGFTDDISPTPDSDSNNGSYDKDEDDEDALPTFENIPAECIRGSDGLVSPKKGKAISAFICCILLYWCLK